MARGLPRITIRFPPEELVAIAECAARSNRTPTDWARLQLRAAIVEDMLQARRQSSQHKDKPDDAG